MAGKKVVIVEFDLNNPTLASKFKCERHKGIADYLKGSIEAEEVIKKSQETKIYF